jgi:hypothetical protein
MSVRIKFEPRDLWIGAFVDTERRRLYLCVVPCFPVVLAYNARQA